MNKIVWLTGKSGSGKTTVAQKVQNFVDCLILDGDAMRKSISLEEGFSESDREKHNLRVARLAKELVKQRNVIVSVIAPSRYVRDAINDICAPKWVYIQKDSLPERKDHFYEVPEKMFTIDHDIVAVEDSARQIVELFDVKEKNVTFKESGVTINVNFGSCGAGI